MDPPQRSTGTPSSAAAVFYPLVFACRHLITPGLLIVFTHAVFIFHQCGSLGQSAAVCFVFLFHHLWLLFFLGFILSRLYLSTLSTSFLFPLPFQTPFWDLLFFHCTFLMAFFSSFLSFPFISSPSLFLPFPSSLYFPFLELSNPFVPGVFLCFLDPSFSFSLRHCLSCPSLSCPVFSHVLVFCLHALPFFSDFFLSFCCDPFFLCSPL